LDVCETEVPITKQSPERTTKMTISNQLSWEETAQAMAVSGEDWSEWNTTVADGLEEIPWDVEKGE
jgi:hypothetical protein